MIKGRYYLFILVFCIASCKAQKIKVPDPALKKLFGQWKYQGSSGGFSGRGADWPLNENICITFKNNGIFQRSGKSMPLVKDTSKLVKSSTIFSGEEVYLVDYKNNIDQSIQDQR